MHPSNHPTPRALLLCIMALIAASSRAQDLSIVGTIRDLLTENGIDSATVEVLTPANALVTKVVAEIPLTTDETTGFASIRRKAPKEGARFEVFVPARATYILQCSKPGYETVRKTLHLADMKNGKRYDAGNIYLQKKNKTLREAVVKGTRIKMFYKGDTLVYNADAFVLPDGSMLADLVKQLPGAELRDGNVYVNGRLVENLLLGGKDFFNGNPQAALKNLPAYVVNRVKVYEKAGELSQTTGTDMGDKQYVLDVHLKREYISSYIGMLKAGYGTADRYEGGLFAMRFDERQSFTLTGDLNNLNTDNSYVRSATFTRRIAGGRHERQQAAADYRYEPDGKLKLTANVTFEHRANHTLQSKTGETYLQGGNTFSRSSSHSHDHSTELNGNTQFTLRPRSGRLYELVYAGGYHHSDNRSTLLSASLDSLPAAVHTAALLDSIFMAPMGEAFRRSALNRLRNALRGEESQTSHKLTAHFSQAFRENLLDLKGSFGHDRRNSNDFDIYHLEYPRTQQADDYRHRFADDKARRYDYTLQGRYFWKYLHTSRVNGQLTAGYTLAGRHAHNDRPLYRLDLLDDAFGADGGAPLGSLPAEHEDLLRCIDPDDSYYATRRTLRHTASLDWLHDLPLPHAGRLELKAALQLHREEARLDYRRFGTAWHTTRRAWLPEPAASLRWRPLEDDKSGNKLSVSLQYKSTASQPDLLHVLDMTDASNPLFITLGNPDLKPTRSHRLTLQLQRNNLRGRALTASMDYQRWHNQTAREQRYDRTSGVNTLRWVNVSGNWQTDCNLWCSVPLNRKGNLSLQARLVAGYRHSADLSFTSDEERTAGYTVGTLSVRPNLSVSYQSGTKYYVNGGIWVDRRHVDGQRPDFARIRTTGVTYFLDGQATLPGQLVFNTGFQLTTRYGLNDASLDDQRPVWNASLSRTFRSLTLALKGCDLLGSNRYTTIDVNASGRTETCTNTLPRYVLLSLTWRFNHTPKSKP